MSTRLEPSAVSSGSSVVNSYNRQGKEVGALGVAELFTIQRTSLIANETTNYIYGTDSDFIIDSIQASVIAPNLTISLVSPQGVVLNTIVQNIPLLTVGSYYVVPKGHTLRMLIPTVATIVRFMCRQCNLIESVVT